MSFSVVIVLHDSAAHLRAAAGVARRAPSRAPAGRSASTAARATTAPQIARDWGARDARARRAIRGSARPTTPGSRVAAHPVTRAAEPRLRGCSTTGSRALARSRGARARSLVPRLLNPDGSVQRSAHPLPGGRDAYLAALVPPRMLPRGLRERLEPFRADGRRAASAGRSPPASLRRTDAAARPRARSTRGTSSSTRTSTCACARARRASRPSCSPRSRSSTSAATARAPPSPARRSCCRPRRRREVIERTSERGRWRATTARRR